MSFHRLLVLGIVIGWLELLATETPGPRYWPVQLGDMLFAHVELADTDAARTRGLMERTSLPDDGGMLFVFPKPEVHRFWMKNTRIPLDILYLDTAGRITAIHTMAVEPPQAPGESEEGYHARLPLYSSVRPAIAAIELNAGMAESLGLKPGQSLPGVKLPTVKQ